MESQQEPMEMKQNENKLKQENMEWKYEMELLLYGMYHQFEMLLHQIK